MNAPIQSPHSKTRRGKLYSAKLFRFLSKQGFSRRKLRHNKWVKKLGHQVLHRDLWRWERDSLARSWLIGTLVATSPFFGFHTFLAAVFLVLFRANIPLGILLILLTNPITIIPFYTFAYFLGCEIISHHPPHTVNLKMMINGGLWSVIQSPKVLLKDFLDFFFTLTVGCLSIGTVIGLAGYWLIKLCVKPTTLLRPSHKL